MNKSGEGPKASEGATGAVSARLVENTIPRRSRDRFRGALRLCQRCKGLLAAPKEKPHPKTHVQLSVRPVRHRNALVLGLAKGEIASLSGAMDVPRDFQISVPVQPGNSGGALVDTRGNVVGVVVAKLSTRAALRASGVLPEAVNYAVKSSFLLSFLESVPELAAKLKEPNNSEVKFEEAVAAAEQAAVLVLVY